MDRNGNVSPRPQRNSRPKRLCNKKMGIRYRQIRIHNQFENDGQFANSPAQNVFVYLKVNPQIDFNSLKLKSFGFGKHDFFCSG